ncbi:hypothetical protein [Amycolatopsis sp. cmx-8-4]|uniref:hypothetical protein n=1 Tax=Amycolatopsis sp. cmx-8-4 TaxID=2790947 RepID=UPI00397ADBBA
MRIFLAVLAAMGLVVTPATPATADQSRSSPDAAGALLAAFDDHALVAKSSPDVGSFLLDLVRDPRLPGKVNDIAVECGNSLYQPILDAYIAGADIPIADVRPVWRNTTQPSCGFSTFYEQLFPLVRQVNTTLPASRRIRVLACDPPVDWSRIHHPADFTPFEDRDPAIVSVLKTQVLQKHRKALLLFGLGHLTHNTGSAVGRLEQEYPGSAFVVADHRGFLKDNARLEPRLGSWPSLITLKSSWLGQLDASYFPLDRDFPPGTKGFPGVDAYLYEGPAGTLLREPISARTVLDTDFLTEMRRRATALEAPPDSLEWPEFFLQRERDSGVLLGD